MVAVLEFVFSSFWIWLGCVILVSAPFCAFNEWLKIVIKTSPKKDTKDALAKDL